jgi:hypothetical protein
VSDGARTRDILDHNQVLYQLSYTHHDCGARFGDRVAQSRQSTRRADASITAVAAAWASSWVGPGGATNSVAR